MNAQKDTSPVIAYEANCSMNRELGNEFRISEFITEEKIEACASLLQKAVDDFFVDAEADLKQLEMLTSLPSGTVDAQLLQTHTYNIKSLAKVLGFSLITEICVHYLSAIGDDKLPIEKKYALLQKLTEVLRISFDQRIRDDGGAVGKKLLGSLRIHFTNG